MAQRAAARDLPGAESSVAEALLFHTGAINRMG